MIARLEKSQGTINNDRKIKTERVPTDKPDKTKKYKYEDRVDHF